MKSVDQEKTSSFSNRMFRQCVCLLYFRNCQSTGGSKRRLDARHQACRIISAPVALFAFGLFAAVAGTVLAMRAAIWVPDKQGDGHETEQASLDLSVFATFAISYG